MIASLNMRNDVLRVAHGVLFPEVMKTPTTRFFVVTVALATLFALGACSKSSDNSVDAAGAAGSTSATSTINATCNAFTSSDLHLAGRIATYYDSSSTFVADHVRVRITTLTSSFDSGGYTLQFFRWQANSSGTTSLDSTPLTFTIYYGNQAISSAMTSIDSAAVTSLRHSTGVGTSSVDFFNKTTIVVAGVDNSWQVLKTVLYSGSTAVTTTDALMPVFQANPNTYAAVHPAVLNGLHPFTGQASNGYTDAQWVALSNQNCFQ